MSAEADALIALERRIKKVKEGGGVIPCHVSTEYACKPCPALNKCLIYANRARITHPTVDGSGGKR